jgi:integrase/recombinase XerD
MASVRIVLVKKKTKEGEFPLAIRIIKDRKPSYIYLGHSLSNESFWDDEKQRVKKSHPNSARLNNLLLKRLAEADDKLLDLEIQNKDLSVKVIKKSIKSDRADLSFFTQANMFVDNMRRQGKYNRVGSDQPKINRFSEFLNGEDITFPEITVPLLNKFKAYLKGTRNSSERTIINHLLIIRTIYNQAIAGNIVDTRHYPFGKGKITIKFPESLKVGLSIEEVQRIENVDLAAMPYLNHVRNLWLISFYFAGMRVSDLLRLKWCDFQNDRLYYTMGKNLKGGSLKVPAKAAAILGQYKDQEKKNDLVFPELKALDKLDQAYDVQRKTSYATKRIDKALALIAHNEDVKLTKNLTMHIARHTFGNISRDKIPVQVLQSLYRHTEIKTTIGYQSNFIHKEADAALDAVIDF